MSLISYQFNEGSCLIPHSPNQDMTLNLLQFDQLKTTLVISRQKLLDDDDYIKNYKNQLEQLKYAMKNFVLLSLETIVLGENNLSALQSHSTFDIDAGPLEQYQCAFEVDRTLLVIGYSRLNAFNDESLKHWQSIKESILLRELC